MPTNFEYYHGKPFHADIFMRQLEFDLFKPKIYLRYIDDIIIGNAVSVH